MTKHTSAHLKIFVGPFLVRVFYQNKESKLSANIFHQKKNINETRCHFKSVLVALTTATTKIIF